MKFPSSPMIEKWQFKTFLFVLLVAVVGYCCFILIGGWQGVVKAVKEVGWQGVIFALLCSLANYFLRFMRWHHYLKVLGYTIPWLNNLRIYLAGFCLTTTPGKAGEALRSIFLKHYEVSYRQSLGAFLAERFSDFIAILLLAIFSLIYGGLSHKEAFLLIGGSLAGVIIILGAIQKEAWLAQAKKFVKKVLPAKFEKGVSFIFELLLACRKCFNAKSLLYATLLGLIAWGAEAFAFYYLLKLVGTDITLSWAIFIYSFSLIVGALTFLPGGLAGTEITMWQLLLLQGVSSSLAVAVTVIIRLTTLWFSVALGLFFMPKKNLIT